MYAPAALCGCSGKDIFVPPQKGYISNRELCLQLGVNKRTLARYRASGDLTYSLIGGKVYYSEKDARRLMAIFKSKN